MKQIFLILFCVLFLQTILQAQTPNNDASSFGFKPEASGVENTTALQKAVDEDGTILVRKSSMYKLAGTVYVGSNTTLDNEVLPVSTSLLTNGKEINSSCLW